MYTSIEIYSRLNDYLNRKVTLYQLEDWLVGMLPVYLTDPSSAAAELAGVVELGLAEIGAGIRTERSVRTLLSKFVSNNPFVTAQYPLSDLMDFTSNACTVLEAKGFD